MAARAGSRSLLPFAVLTLGVALGLVHAPASADILVLRDGSRLTTRGAWEQRGSLLVFTLPDGTLSSLKASTVDLEASVAATEASKRPPKEASPPPALRPPVAVLTDADVRRVTADEEEQIAARIAGSPDAEEPADEVPEESGDFEIVRWEQTYDDASDVLEITGIVSNEAPGIVFDLAVEAILIDGEGREVARGRADLPVAGMRQGGQAGFSVSFPDQFRVEAVRFEVSGRRQPLLTPTPGGEGSGAEEGPQAEGGSQS